MSHEYSYISSISEIAMRYAIERHHIVNQYFDSIYPYSYHLERVVEIAKKFIYLIPEEDREDVLGGCWAHDIIEDTRESFNDVKKAVNLTVAEYSYALTNEKGKTRKERANEKYYREIRLYKHASFIKLCDRIANIEYSKSKNSSMFKKYQEEHPKFYEGLFDGRWLPMWNYLLKIL